MDLAIEDQLGALVDDALFAQLVERRSTFNLFEALGAIRGEVRHSHFLAFLLDPSSTHGLGSEPLKRFLRLFRVRNRFQSSLENDARRMRYSTNWVSAMTPTKITDPMTAKFRELGIPSRFTRF